MIIINYINIHYNYKLKHNYFYLKEYDSHVEKDKDYNKTWPFILFILTNSYDKMCPVHSWNHISQSIKLGASLLFTTALLAKAKSLFVHGIYNDTVQPL